MSGEEHSLPSNVGALSLRRNFSWTFAGNVVYAGCQWGMLAAIAKLGTPNMVGQFALAIAITTPVFAFLNLQLREILGTDSNREYSFTEFFSLRLLTTLACLLVVAGIVLALDYGRTLVVVILIMSLGRAFDALSDLFYGLFQQAESMDRVAKAMSINGMLSLIGVAMGLGLTGSLVVAVLGSTMASGVTLLTQNVPAGLRMVAPLGQNPRMSRLGSLRQFLPHSPLSARSDLIRMALPLGLVMLLVSLNSHMPRYFIDQFHGERELGIFSALAYLIVAGTTVVSALGQSASPRLASMYSAKRYRDFRRFALKLAVLGLGIGALGTLLTLVVGRPVLARVYTDEYANHMEVMLILTAAAGPAFAASFLGYGMTAARIFRPQVALFLSVVLVSAVTCAVLIPRFGLIGGAISVLLATLVQFVVSALILNGAMKKETSLW